MTLETLSSTLPSYAKDLKLNLSSVLRQPELTEQQLWGTALASAIASRNSTVIGIINAESRAHLSPAALEAAKSAAAIMGMNNIYYRFTHLSGNPKYSTIPARLRMQALRTHGVEPLDFELWCTAVSAINGCGACMASHEHVLREKGLTEEKIAAAIRIAAVIHAVSVVLDAENVIAEPEPVIAEP
ncbi:MAG: carboxymuconolactone decarboxylase family protein [Bryobacteraceae bacterium]|nr:carboxymuconolactone decarboxylase family protein [Bryobacteraceae bacterium]